MFLASENGIRTTVLPPLATDGFCGWPSPFDQNQPATCLAITGASRVAIGGLPYTASWGRVPSPAQILRDPLPGCPENPVVTKVSPEGLGNASNPAIPGKSALS